MGEVVPGGVGAAAVLPGGVLPGGVLPGGVAVLSGAAFSGTIGLLCGRDGKARGMGRKWCSLTQSTRPGGPCKWPARPGTQQVPAACAAPRRVAWGVGFRVRPGCRNLACALHWKAAA